jgi:biopolymer transport protein ExbD
MSDKKRAKAQKKQKQLDMVQEEPNLDLTPMIDVTFQLLIFFLLTLKFKILEGKLESLLPLDKGLSNKQQEVQAEDVEIILKVLEEDKTKPASQRRVRYTRNGTNTPFGISKPEWNPTTKSYVCDPPDTLEKIMQHLQKVRKDSPDSKAKINAWPEVPHDRVVNVLNMMIEANFTNISYSGIPPSLIADLQSGKINSSGTPRSGG